MTTRRAGKPKSTTPEPGRAPTSLETALDYTFTQPHLLQLALTHRSFAYEARGAEPENTLFPKHKNPPGTDNEQLEFLGDAILGVLVSEALYRTFPDSSEGELTRMRAVLVSRKRMADFGAALALADHILLGKSAEQNGGRLKPALLANAAEAVIAAMHLDAPAGQQAAHALVHRLLIEPELANLRNALATEKSGGALRDHKTLLQEKVQSRAQTSPTKLRYIDISMSGPPHQRVFVVEAQLEDHAGTRTLSTAEGPSKKEAQQRAAELALATWDATA